MKSQSRSPLSTHSGHCAGGDDGLLVVSSARAGGLDLKICLLRQTKRESALFQS
jgi:hypothetical protein